MLDKSVPFVDVLMHRKAGAAIPVVEPSEGYRVVHYKEGDEAAWARIETSVLEFSNEQEALRCFRERYMPYAEELLRRCLFIETEDGEKVATATSWWSYSGKRRDPWLHWVAVDPAHQNKGLGKAVVSAALRLTAEIEGDRDYYLHTQTWSHKAIGIYENMGFCITDTKNLGRYANDGYEDALRILRAVRGGVR